VAAFRSSSPAPSLSVTPLPYTPCLGCCACGGVVQSRTQAPAADLDRYSWTQTLAEVAGSIPVPRGTKARQVVVDIKRTSLTAGLKGEPPCSR